MCSSARSDTGGAYEPTLGQLRFHEDTGRLRVFVEKECSGKTTAIIAELDAWCRGSNRWRVTEQAPITAVLLTSSKTIYRDLLNFGFRYKAFCPHRSAFTYQNGSSLIVAAPTEESVHRLSGVGPTVVAFDGVPDRRIWREMRMRRGVKSVMLTARSWDEMVDLL